MIDALISEEEFYEAIANLENKQAFNLIYVRGHHSFIVAPLYHLADVVNEEKRKKISSPEYAKYLKTVERQWLSIIACAAIEHPKYKEIFKAIPLALNGEYSPKTLPKWVKLFEDTLITGEDDLVHVPAYTQIVSGRDGIGRWGASSETAAELYKVLNALGYPPRPISKPGVKPKGHGKLES